jgi:hypothetical protein
MSETPWTPGPWFASDWSLDDGPNVTTIESRKHTGSAYWPGGIEKFRIADTAEGINPLPDARLIAAAPELADACEAARAFISNGIKFGFIRMPETESDPVHTTLAKIFAALAKAKGETP